MYSPAKLASKYLKYWFTASNGKGHGVHSPFVFDFIINILNDRNQYPCFQKMEQLRKELLKDDSLLTVEDLGAGSRTGSQKQRTIKSIARHALKPKKFGQLLYRIVNYYQPEQLLELGTSLGITSAYLSSATKKGNLVSLEGAPAVAKAATNHFKKLDLKNIKVITGNFDNTLGPVLSDLKKVDFAFIDGNHRKEPTTRYFNALLPFCNDATILIFDDIHWSAEMEEAWETIKAHERVLLTIDLFFIGLVFFRKDFIVKQHFSIRF